MGRPRRTLHLLASALAATLAACATSAPPVEVHHATGTVRAADRASAERFSTLVAGLQPRIRQLLPDTSERPTEVWVQDRLQHRVGTRTPLDVKGFTLISSDAERGRIHMRRDADYPQWFLAHELVHALLGDSWDTIPAVLEEGLCDAVAARLEPAIAPRIRALRAIEASLFFGRMPLVVEHAADTPGDRRRETEIWFHYDRGPSKAELHEALEPATLDLDHRPRKIDDAMYGLGFLIADRILREGGVRALHRLCLEARRAGRDSVSPERLLAAAGLSTDAERYAAAGDLLGATEFDNWVELLPTFHADLCVQLFGGRFGELPLEAFLARVKPVLVLAGGARIDLAGHLQVREALEARWPGTPSTSLAARTGG